MCNPHPGLSSPPGRATTSPSSGSESAADPEPQAAHTPAWGGGGPVDAREALAQLSKAAFFYKGNNKRVNPQGSSS